MRSVWMNYEMRSWPHGVEKLRTREPRVHQRVKQSNAMMNHSKRVSEAVYPACTGGTVFILVRGFLELGWSCAEGERVVGLGRWVHLVRLWLLVSTGHRYSVHLQPTSCSGIILVMLLRTDLTKLWRVNGECSRACHDLGARCWLIAFSAVNPNNTSSWAWLGLIYARRLLLMTVKQGSAIDLYQKCDWTRCPLFP